MSDSEDEDEESMSAVTEDDVILDKLWALLAGRQVESHDVFHARIQHEIVAACQEDAGLSCLLAPTIDPRLVVTSTSEYELDTPNAAGYARVMEDIRAYLTSPAATRGLRFRVRSVYEDHGWTIDPRSDSTTYVIIDYLTLVAPPDN